jgi:hypothetical protein
MNPAIKPCSACGCPSTLLCDGRIVKRRSDGKVFRIGLRPSINPANWRLEAKESWSCDAPICRQCASREGGYIACMGGGRSSRNSIDLCPMGLYSFRKRFSPYVEDGSKQHTVRALRKHPDKPGNTCYLYEALKTKFTRHLLNAPCLGVEDIEILPHADYIAISQAKLSASEMDSFAWRDGFRPLPDKPDGAWEDMRQYWEKMHPDSVHTLFIGHLTHWSYARRFGK